MKQKYLVFFSMLMIAALLAVPASAKTEKTGPFAPGQPLTFTQTVPVNLVFIGYDEMVDTQATLDELPAGYAPVVRYPQFYGLPGRYMGLQFNFNYKVIQAPSALEDKFFHYLSTVGEEGDPTLYQLFYNDNENNVLDVTGPVLYIDGPTVEHWLWNNLRSYLGGRNAERGYTIFFVNWYGRPDFKFHVYTKTDEADPDTGYNFGELRASRKVIAWGGSHSRTWFYDLSAGPEAWTDNWYVDGGDVDGDGFDDYRMPPVWEYTAGGFRDPAALSSDLGLVARYVGINLLFTTSPLYDPLVTAPGIGGNKVQHIEMFQDDPASNGLDWIDTNFAYEKLHAFQPYYDWMVNLEDNDPIDPGAQRSFRIFADVLLEDDCWNAYGTPFAQLFCFFDANKDSYVPPYDPKDYVGEVWAFNTTADNLGSQFGLLGFADDNWVDGTQSYVFEFDSAEYRALGYGFSTTTVHEFGHHIGMSHPHDGYDSETGVDYGPGADFYFAWSGDESNTIMHYMDLSTSFGRFDQDNMYRYEFAGYLNWANDLLAQIRVHPHYATVKHLVNAANTLAAQAVSHFNAWQYLQAATKARQAYELMGTAAEMLGIARLEPMRISVPNIQVEHQVDPIRFPNN